MLAVRQKKSAPCVMQSADYLFICRLLWQLFIVHEIILDASQC